MLLRHRPPGIDSVSGQPRPGLEHLQPTALSVLHWLNANRVDYVVVGPVAHAIRGDTEARGPVAIVPAPYGRNWERLTRALIAEHAGLRGDREPALGPARGSVTAVRLTAEKLARGRRWLLRFGEHDLDIESAGTRPASAGSGPETGTGSGSGADGHGGARRRTPRFQELLYEATRFEIADGVSVEVASPEDLEHYSHLRRTGIEPEFRVTRISESGAATAPATETPADTNAAG